MWSASSAQREAANSARRRDAGAKMHEATQRVEDAIVPQQARLRDALEAHAAKRGGRARGRG